jgi:hypothetical protein
LLADVTADWTILLILRFETKGAKAAAAAFEVTNPNRLEIARNPGAGATTRILSNPDGDSALEASGWPAVATAWARVEVADGSFFAKPCEAPKMAPATSIKPTPVNKNHPRTDPPTALTIFFI